MALRALSLERHCLVASATQADADSYDRYTLGMSNFSESKTKLAHVTGMLGLNQTEEEKKKGITRINKILAREEEAVATDTVSVIGHLATGQPLIASFVPKKGVV